MTTKNLKTTAAARKVYGPKTNRFHGYNKCMRVNMTRTSFINKRSNVEAYLQSCTAKGIVPVKFLGMFVGKK